MKLIAVTFAALSLVAISSADLKSELKEMNARTGNAMVKGDMKSLEAMMKAGVTKDFTYTEAGKTMNFSQMMEMMKQSMGAMKVTSAHTDIVTVKEKGNMGVATQKRTLTGIMTTPDKKTHKMSFGGMTTDTFVKVGKEWKMQKMVWGKNTMMMDGKPMDPAKMGGGK